MVLWAPNSIDWVVAALAVTYAGGTLVPANSRYTAHEVADIVDRTDATLVVIADGFLGRTQIADLRALSPAAPILDLADIGILAAVVDELDLAAVEARPTPSPPTTSPTSCSRPAPAVAPKACSARTGRPSPQRPRWSAVGEVSSADRYLVISPFFHSYGYKVGVLVGLLHGCTLYPMATFDADAALALIESERITMVPGAPAIFLGLLESPAFADHRHLVPAVRQHGRRERAGRPRRAAAARAELRPGDHRVRHDRVRRRHDVPPRRQRRDRRHHRGRAIDGMETAIADPETGEHLPAGPRASCCCADRRSCSATSTTL